MPTDNPINPHIILEEDDEPAKKTHPEELPREDEERKADLDPGKTPGQAEGERDPDTRR